MTERSFQHKYHTKIDDLIERTMNNMRAGLVGKLASVLESVLSKLGRYDEGSVIGSILSFTVRRTSFGHHPLKTIITDLNVSRFRTSTT